MGLVTAASQVRPRGLRPGSLRRLLVLALAFALARSLLVGMAADRISEPDQAEVKLMVLGDAWADSGRLPSPAQLLQRAREGVNAPHGGFLPVSLIHAALSGPAGGTGRYGRLKLGVILLATLSLLCWLAVAERLGGPVASACVALLWLLCPPSMLGASLVAWGSHPEAAALLGPAVIALLMGRGIGGAAIAGGLLGLVGGFSLLLVPVCAVLALGWAWDLWWEEPPTPWLPRAGALAATFLLVAGGLGWIAQAGDASVTESAGHSPLQLLHQARSDVDPLVAETARNLLPPRIVGATWPGADGPPATARAWDRAYLALLLAVLVASLPGPLRDRAHRGRQLALLIGVPLVLALVLSALGPRRPWVPPRYLLALWPPALLTLSLAAGRARGPVGRGLALAAVALWTLPGLAAQADLWRLGRLGGFASYEPSRYVAAGIGHVGYEEAPAVAAFLDRRDKAGQSILGFGLAAGEGGGEALLLDGRPAHLVDPADLLERLARLRLEQPELDASILHRNLGWGLAVFAPDRRGTWLSVLDRIGDGRVDVAFGLGQGLRLSVDGCRSLRGLLGPDRAAILQGAASFDDAELPPCADR